MTDRPYIIKNGERRLPCLVPFCGRTAPYKAHTEIICGKHWRMVPKRHRAALTRRRRRLLRIMSTSPRYPGALNAYRRMWRRIRRAAIEAGSGIG